MWVVTIDRPYYSSVELFDDEKKAKQRYEELLEENEVDGNYNVTVCLAKVEECTKIKTYY